jgi:hypothetical protein
MTDDEFLRSVLDASLPAGAFHNRDHLRLAWLAVRRHGADVAPAVVGHAIRRFAETHGQGLLYHQTMTEFWVRAVAHHVHESPDIDHFDRFLEAFPGLLDRQLPLRHWTRPALYRVEARARWESPDIQPVPF